MDEPHRKGWGKRRTRKRGPLLHLKAKVNILFEILKIDFGLEQYNGFFIEGFRKCLPRGGDTFLPLSEERLMRFLK